VALKAKTLSKTVPEKHSKTAAKRLAKKTTQRKSR
jgi:hypothetical protein